MILPGSLALTPEQRERNASTTVVVGMSGGVDSSVSALILKEQGYRVLGMFMKNWDDSKDEQCTAEADYRDVARVCEQIGIPYYSVEFIEEYWTQVFEEFLEGYRRGDTPNPDILCNREIKFNAFLKQAKKMGGQYLATGHYARSGSDHSLLRGLDPGKDQSYFLYTLKRDILAQVMFPIGDLQKSQVREIAREAGLVTSAKKDSTGICFIGERKFREFLSKYVQARPGEFRLMDDTRVGEHRGVAYYTLGQRRGLGLGGEGDRWYVVAKDVDSNVVYVERGDDHPALWADELFAREATWVGEIPQGGFKCTAKVRYRQIDQVCEVEMLEHGRLRVRFEEPQRAITPAQSIVFYQGETCLGGAVIERAGESYFARGLTVQFTRSSVRVASDMTSV